MDKKEIKCTPHVVSKHTQYIPCIDNAKRTLTYEVTEQVVDQVSHCIVSQSKIKIYDPYENDDYRCSDFAMENLIAVGKQLNPTHLVGDTSVSQANIEATLETLQKDYN